MKQADTETAKAERKYKKDFDKQFRPSKEIIEPEELEFAQRDFCRPNDKKHKLISVVEGPFRVVSVTDATVFVRMGEM